MLNHRNTKLLVNVKLLLAPKVHLTTLTTSICFNEVSQTAK